MKKKGFTLIELLVVIAIIAMLLAILMPALNKVKKLAMRLVCGTNVKGLGTAMNVYAFDYDDQFPRKSGSRIWADTTGNWENPNANFRNNGNVTIAASLYMLIREADVSPKSFICPASSDVEFKLGTVNLDHTLSIANTLELTDVHDFGPRPAGSWATEGIACHVSYSYQQVYKHTAGGKLNLPTASGNAAKVILADKSPFSDPLLDSSITLDALWMEKAGKLSLYAPSPAPAGTIRPSSDPLVRVNNSGLHDREGQNVLYNDGHAEFTRRADCGMNDDNIYNRFVTNGDILISRRQGFAPRDMKLQGYSMNSTDDTVLVSDSLQGGKRSN